MQLIKQEVCAIKNLAHEKRCCWMLHWIRKPNGLPYQYADIELNLKRNLNCKES
jgi:hypothetical protein